MKNLFKSSCLVVALLASVALVGCGGGGGGGGNPVAPTQTGTLQGTVTLPQNSPQNSIRLDTTSQSLEGTKVWIENYPEISGITDKDGKYTISKVPFGENRVVANIKIGNEEYKWRSEVQNVINTVLIIVPQIVMQPANTSISGTVYDAVTKKAIQGVIVEVWGQRSTSDADGKYTVFNMPAGSWDVTYTKKGYQTFKSPMSFADGIETSGNFYLVPEGTSDSDIASNSGSIALTELVPAYKAESIHPTQTTISAFFNGAKINTDYAVIKFTSGNPNNTEGYFSFIDDRVVYTHNENWPANTKIAVEIGNLKDFFGNNIASFSFEFTTNNGHWGDEGTKLPDEIQTNYKAMNSAFVPETINAITDRNDLESHVENTFTKFVSPTATFMDNNTYNKDKMTARLRDILTYYNVTEYSFKPGETKKISDTKYTSWCNCVLNATMNKQPNGNGIQRNLTFWMQFTWEKSGNDWYITKGFDSQFWFEGNNN
jgi:hypothetical protein